MKTCVYVDGFNLYFGSLRGTPYKWLNVRRMSELLLPDHEIVRLRYFTARVSGRPEDPGAPIRQDAYLRALQSVPDLSVHYGHFLSHIVRMPLVSCSRNCGDQVVKVQKTEEKGSDVNLASFMLRDAFANEYEAAVVVSNDSDLVAPIEIVRHELQRVVGILNPHPRASKQLAKAATFTKQIRAGVLEASQFEPVVEVAGIPVRRPDGW